MSNYLVAEDLARQLRQLKGEPEPSPEEQERQAMAMLSRIQQRENLALQRGASPAQAQELALDGILPYDPELARANEEANNFLVGYSDDEVIPG